MGLDPITWHTRLAEESSNTWDHTSTFAGRSTVNLGAEIGPDSVLRIPFDPLDSLRFSNHLRRVLDDPAADQVSGLILGICGVNDGMTGMGSVQEVVDLLAVGSARLPGLRGLYLGDVSEDEFQASWIEQPDPAPLLQAFPDLALLRVRGVRVLGELRHENLRALQLQYSLTRAAAQTVSRARLPALEHLELWLGTPDYEGDVELDDLLPVLSGKLFPRLRYLGLRNAEIADDVAIALASSPLLERIEVLDLSLGCLGDPGVEALLANPALRNLRRLDLHHHAASGPLMDRLQALGLEELDATPEPDAERYVAVGE